MPHELMNDAADDARVGLHRALWKLTLQNAAQAPLYAELWKNADLDVLIAAGPERLGDLPVVSKSQIRSAGPNARTPTTSPRHHVLTGGTTGVPMRIMRSQEEIRFLHEFFQPKKPEGKMKRGLVFSAPYHGTQVPIRTNAHAHSINILDHYSFDYALDVLTEEHDDPSVEARCSFVAGQERVLNAFALFLQDRRIDAAVFNLDFACSQGSHVTPATRNRVEMAMNCTLVDRYSMSEVFGGASQDIRSGWYDPDPHVIYEIIHLDTGILLQEGIGELVVTVLYPFQQAQPMVRYRTGDLAEVAKGGWLATGLSRFRPLGRLAHSIFSPKDGDVILPGSALYDIVFEFELAKRRPMYLDAPKSISDPTRAGLPPFRLYASDDRKSWTLEIAVAETRDRGEVEAILYERLCDHPRSRIADAVCEGEISFVVSGRLDFAD